MISIRRISLGGGFRYLMDSVAVGDGAVGKGNDLARYYAESGTPPGRFLGAGLPDLGEGEGIPVGTEVTETHLERMLVELTDPVDGRPVGAAPRAPAGAAPVAGFDLTFSPSKSVSVAWALADEATKAVIYDCHCEAVTFTLGWAEREVFRSRSGANGVVEEDVSGVVAAAFTHWSSRAGDPQLHDHVVVWNRARSVSDGRWRTLDSRAVFKATTTLSELHQGVLADLLTARLGVGWEPRARRHSTLARYEIDGVPEALMTEFSQRAGQIAEHVDGLRSQFRATHGRTPTAVEDMRLHQLATVATRAAKTHDSLVSLTASWRSRAGSHVPIDQQIAWVSELAGRNDVPLLDASDLEKAILTDAAVAVLNQVSERHATFTRMNLLAESYRTIQGVRFASPDARVTVAEIITALALERSLSLDPPPLEPTPAGLVRPDGTSRLHPPSRRIYTTQAVFDAEAGLLDASEETDGPAVAASVVAMSLTRDLPGRSYQLTHDQARAVEQIATSGRVLDVLVGPAGTGKSTTMVGLRMAWEARYGADSVLGLAPSAAAAEVLGDELGTETDNTAKWLTEWRRLPTMAARRNELADKLSRCDPASAAAQRLRRSVADLDRAIDSRRLRPGQLVIIDEAGMAGTFALDQIVTAARGAGAKVLLVGDWAQLSPIEAGGAFELIARRRGALVPELSDVRRFEHDWEKEASLQLRHGEPAAIDAYVTHNRVHGGSREQVLDALYQAWKHDTEAGLATLMIAPDAPTVAELNARARADRVADGHTAAEGATVADGMTAGVGDHVVTRQNDRTLTTGRRWVKNGDRWTVTAVQPDGGLTARRDNGKGEITLPAGYVRQHVELSYATTAYRAQGRTVDTSHTIANPLTTREVLYVAATRGRYANHLYIDTAYDPDPETSHPGAGATTTAQQVLAGVLRRSGNELSAHRHLEGTLERSESQDGAAAQPARRAGRDPSAPAHQATWTPPETAATITPGL